MYDYEELKATMVGMVETSINELLLVNEEDNPLRVKRILDVIEKCQVSLQWIEMYSNSSKQIRPMLKPILDYYLNGLADILMHSQQ